MNEYKIVFSGPVGSGKTTAIQTISDIEVINTDEVASDETAKLKLNTTVAMDYGVIKVSEHERVHLYGTPGQQRFDFMWDILTEGSLGIILLINNYSNNRLSDLELFLEAFQSMIDKTKVVIGITHTDCEQTSSLDEYHSILAKHGITAAVFEVDARDKKDICYLLEALLCSISPGYILNS